MHGQCIEIEFDGQIYKLWPQSKNKSLASYFRCFKRNLGVDYLHRKVWEKYNGSIPDGFEVHHKDEDTLNNDIKNLELVTLEFHRSIHRKESVKRGLEMKKNGHLDRIREMAKEWHSSQDGSIWHKEHGKKIFGKENRFKVKMKCIVCDSEYESDSIVAVKNGGSKFCSNNCKSEHRRRSGVDDVKEVCEICGVVFIKNKYSKKRLCSRTCSGVYRRKKKSI